MTTLDHYRNMLRINKLRLDDELEIQAEVQDRIGMEVAIRNTRMLEATEELKRVEARLTEDLKERDERATVDQIKARVIRHEDRRRAWQVAQQRREEHEMWDSLLKAWITKGYKLADIGALYASDYFAIKTISKPDGERRRDLSAIDEESRSALRRASEEKAPTRRRAEL